MAGAEDQPFKLEIQTNSPCLLRPSAIVALQNQSKARNVDQNVSSMETESLSEGSV